jgi:hypothetical protein
MKINKIDLIENEKNKIGVSGYALVGGLHAAY